MTQTYALTDAERATLAAQVPEGAVRRVLERRPARLQDLARELRVHPTILIVRLRQLRAVGVVREGTDERWEAVHPAARAQAVLAHRAVRLRISSTYETTWTRDRCGGGDKA